MEYAKSGIDDLYAKLSIDEEDEGGIIVKDVVTEQDKDSFVLIGRSLRRGILILKQCRTFYQRYGGQMRGWRFMI